MTKEELQKFVENEIEKLVDPDGFDMAFYEGIQHVLDHCGDGGISQQYIEGIKVALDSLDEGEIEKFEGDDKYPTQLGEDIK